MVMEIENALGLQPAVHLRRGDRSDTCCYGARARGTRGGGEQWQGGVA